MPSTRSERVRTASRQRREHERQEVRQTILDAAVALFVEQGYAGFSLRQVAERIGYSATTIYLYFSDKDDLIFTLADEGFRRFGARLTEAAAGTADPLGRIFALGRAYVAFGIEEPIYYQLMFMQRGDFLLSCRAGEERPRVDTLGILQQAFAEAIDAGYLQPGAAPADADALWALAHGIVALHIAIPTVGRERAEAAATVGFQALIDGLRAGRE
ncbi:MAG: Transcriptional regulator, AcrR family [uncultured Thermomicrobiales bacterium]|uniref:Transcriptional regulator, AcrR family n=1 Tax=uncultured Thermomicrobiales bacterium TaxID=1645740 RepID=A0A6J4VYJ8_9BACT|nr:MAG: Transcriptional regulator, AcrR family [uncultured Thermomicrobiales bacterium]